MRPDVHVRRGQQGAAGRPHLVPQVLEVVLRPADRRHRLLAQDVDNGGQGECGLDGLNRVVVAAQAQLGALDATERALLSPYLDRGPIVLTEFRTKSSELPAIIYAARAEGRRGLNGQPNRESL